MILQIYLIFSRDFFFFLEDLKEEAHKFFKFINGNVIYKLGIHMKKYFFSFSGPFLIDSRSFSISPSDVALFSGFRVFPTRNKFFSNILTNLSFGRRPPISKVPFRL